MPSFRTKNAVVEAIQWTGHNWEDVFKFFTNSGTDYRRHACPPTNILTLSTSRITMTIYPEDWIIRNEDGMLSSCTTNTLVKTYEPNTSA